jgi:hypothetical protein
MNITCKEEQVMGIEERCIMRSSIICTLQHYYVTITYKDSTTPSLLAK